MHRHDAGCFVHTFPLFCFVRCYACHACLCHLLAFFESLHACLHVYAWVLLASVSSILQHNEAMDIWSKPTFVPRRHHPCLLSCFLAYWFGPDLDPMVFVIVHTPRPTSKGLNYPICMYMPACFKNWIMHSSPEKWECNVKTIYYFHYFILGSNTLSVFKL